jgi:hypothetical protein
MLPEASRISRKFSPDSVAGNGLSSALRNYSVSYHRSVNRVPPFCGLLCQKARTTQTSSPDCVPHCRV